MQRNTVPPEQNTQSELSRERECVMLVCECVQSLMNAPPSSVLTYRISERAAAVLRLVRLALAEAAHGWAVAPLRRSRAPRCS